MNDIEFDIHLGRIAAVAAKERRRLASKSTAMPLLSYFFVGSLALIALFFVAVEKKRDAFRFDRTIFSVNDLR